MSKPDYPHPLIAREGWPFLAIAVVLALGASLFWSAWLAGLLWIAALFVLQFFRDPPREVPGDALTVVSPADGRVVVVEKAVWKENLTDIKLSYRHETSTTSSLKDWNNYFSESARNPCQNFGAEPFWHHRFVSALHAFSPQQYRVMVVKGMNTKLHSIIMLYCFQYSTMLVFLL
jgi:phosphatidylserine decarboxylase